MVAVVDSIKGAVDKLTGLVLGDTSKAQPQAYHPLNPLSPDELQYAARIIRRHAEAEKNGSSLRFKALTMLEPPKLDLVAYLLASRSRVPDRLPRLAEALVVQKTAEKTAYTEYIVSLTDNRVVSSRRLDPAEHAPLDPDEQVEAEQILLNDPEFIEVVKRLKLPEGSTVVGDSWPYGTDTFEDRPRLIPFMLYFRPGPNLDTNHYAYPLPLIPAIDPNTRKLHSLNFYPIYGGESTETIEDLWARGEDFPWHRMTGAEYVHDLRDETPRTDLRPLELVQPRGASFEVEGRHVKWQKWEFFVGFNYREGMVIHDVRYDGRDLFHRLSLSEMTVPYGDPRAPFHRKQAFDLGDVGAGFCANQLDLGCDCLGVIHYFSGDVLTADGNVKHLKNVICMHEQDDGIGWKHTNYRTGNATVTRHRQLVLQTILTVANYEYILMWKFDQSAGLHFETRATGILSTHAILPGEKSPYGVTVAEGVFAPNHQHIFSLRIDPAIGGLGEGNSVVQEDSVRMPFDKANPPANNRYGVGYTVEKTLFKKSGFADAAPEKNRVFKIINPSRINPISGRQIGYKLVPMPSQLMLAHSDSVAYARAEFADHHLWVTKHRDRELFSGGHYTNQSNGGAKGIRSWVERGDNVEAEDIVIWHSFGLTHNPRVEDFPVMPSEVHMLSLKPVDFFTTSPSADVPASTQASSRSVLHGHYQGNATVEAGAAVNKQPVGNGENADASGHSNGNGKCCQ